MAIGSRGRGVRSLASLMTSRSSSRVLNLIAAWDAAERVKRPLEPLLFHTPSLNRSFIIKHRLRLNERESFPDFRSTATKLILPIDPTNLSIGGKSVFIGQINFEQLIEEATGIQDVYDDPDIKLLHELDRIPSFDPFIFREWMNKLGRTADERYFALAPSVIAGMEDFVVQEIGHLVSMSLAGSAANAAILRLARKMLSSHYDAELAPLQVTLRMSKEEFRDGMFGWKGLLYYKWLAKRIENDLPGLLSGMLGVRPKRHITREQIEDSSGLVRSIGASISQYFNAVSDRVRTYDASYQMLTRKQDPVGFRAFLLKAPQMFLEMGEYVGMLEHSVDFWKYRSKDIEPSRFTGDDYLELILDLKDGLGSS